MKFAHLRVAINPFGTARGINIFNYPVIDYFFTCLIFKTYCITAKGDYLLYELHKHPGVPVRRGTTYIAHCYRMMNFFFYLLKNI